MSAELSLGSLVASDHGADPGKGQRGTGGLTRGVPALADLESEPSLPCGGSSERDQDHQRAAEGVESQPRAGLQRPQGVSSTNASQRPGVM